MIDKLRTVEIHGKTDYDIGFELGKLFKINLQKNIMKYEEYLKNEQTRLKVEKAKQIAIEKYPRYVQEIYGRADGANVDRDALLFFMCPELYKGIDGCTTVIVKQSKNRVLFAHNEDYIADMDKVALVKIVLGNKWIVGYATAARLLGHAFAYNSDGLVFSNNYIYGADINLENTSRYFTIRDIIESKNIKEVIEKAENASIASSLSVNVLDVKSNEALNIEKDIYDTNITRIETKYARSNHLLTKNTNIKNIPETSIFRYLKSNELLNKLDMENVTMNNLVKILHYHNSDFNKCIYKDINFFKNIENKSKTCATFTFDSGNKKIQIYEYMGNELLDIDFETFEVKRFRFELQVLLIIKMKHINISAKFI